MVDRSAWWVSLALVSACGPSSAGFGDEGGADASTSGADDGVDDDGESALDTDVPGSTTTVDTTAGEESSTGDAAPGCESPGSCDSCLQWETIVEDAQSVWIQHVTIAPDGTIWTIESGRATAPGSVVLRGYDASGEPTFEHPLSEDENADLDTVNALEVAADGTIAVVWTQRVGESEFLTTLDARVADGSPGWTRVLGDDALSVVGEDVAFIENGRVVVVGGRNTGPVSYTGFAGAYGPDDEVAWELDGVALGVTFGSVPAVSATLDGDLVLAGYTDHAMWLGRIAADGAITWTMTEAEVGDVGHGARDIAMSSDGDILVVGTEGNGSGYPLPWMGRFAPDGTALLSMAYPWIASGPHELDSIEVADDGRIFVAGIRVDDAEVEGVWRYAQEVACDGAIAWEWAHVNPSAAYDYANGGGLAWSPRVGLVVGGWDYLGEEDEFRQRGFVALLTP